jgi:hypothetical protein
MLTATLRLFSEESGSSDYSPKTGETIAEIRRSGQYNGEEQQQAAGVTVTLVICWVVPAILRPNAVTGLKDCWNVCRVESCSLRRSDPTLVQKRLT